MILMPFGHSLLDLIVYFGLDSVSTIFISLYRVSTIASNFVYAFGIHHQSVDA